MQSPSSIKNLDKPDKWHQNHVNNIPDLEMENAQFAFKGKNSRFLLPVDTLTVDNAYSACMIGPMNKSGVPSAEKQSPLY